MADTPRRGRVGGSGYTTFYWNGPGNDNIIAFAQQVSHTSPAPVGPGAVPIHPLDEQHPKEIITPTATSMGQITLQLYELYNRTAWKQLSIIANSVDSTEIFQAVAATPNDIKMYKIIKPPAGASSSEPYKEIYHGCVITNVADGETIEVGTMEILKQITVGYTKMTRK
jgi:hypothetical protein